MWQLHNGKEVFKGRKLRLSEEMGLIIEEALSLLRVDPSDVSADKSSAFHVELGRSIGKDHLVVTSNSDDVFYARRKGRYGYLRFVRNLTPEDCSRVVIILKRSKGKGTESYILVAAFIANMIAPPMPWDQKNLSDEEVQVSKFFWDNCALIESPEMGILEDTIIKRRPW